jgi:exodeoxyribonuclease VII large subunit
VVTSPTGAAIHDILTVLARRFPSIPVTVYPTVVQGASAAVEIVAAIHRAERHGQADVLIIGRGGGSLEDLWCFNDESVARAIANCPLPTVSAVGHEVDFTIADFVADFRAPTPSAAAEKLSPDQHDWLRHLEGQQARMVQSLQTTLRRLGNQLGHLGARLRDPRRELMEKAQRLDELDSRLITVIRGRLSREQTRIEHLDNRLAMQSPARQLDLNQTSLNQVSELLRSSMERLLVRKSEKLGHLGQSLNVVSPLATLDRGYAIVQTPNQQVIREAADLKPGDILTARLARGTVEATVTRSHDRSIDLPTASEPN